MQLLKLVGVLEGVILIRYSLLLLLLGNCYSW